jgi:hypothetical protein
MSDAMFDTTAYGEPTRKRAKNKARPETVRLNRPWVLIGRAHHQAQAHLLTQFSQRPSDKEKVAMRSGSVRTRCGHYGYEIKVDGHPLAPLCGACYDIMQASP